MSNMKQELRARETDCSTHINKVSNLIVSLISSTHSTRTFAVKWQLIRDSLEQLLSGVTAASPTDLSTENSELCAFLDSVNSTLNDTVALLERCGDDESRNGGKLLMRSDLSSVASRLDLHNKKFSQIRASGIVPTDSKAIVPLKPSVGVGREEAEFYVKDIFSRLKIGSSTIVRSQALEALEEILLEDDKYAKIIAVDDIALLVSFLELGTDVVIQEKAASVVSVASEFEFLRGALATSGVVPSAIQLLENGSESAKEKAAAILRNLTENCDNLWSVSAQGGASVLLKILNDNDSKAELVASSCCVLRSLSSVEEIRRFMIEEGLVPVLVKLSESKDEPCRNIAVQFIHEVASKDDNTRLIVIKNGFVASLIEVLDPCSGYSSKGREIALGAIEFFCFSSTTLLNVLMSSKFLTHLLSNLKNGDVSVVKLTLWTLSHLCLISEECKKAIGDAGFIRELLRLLEAKSFEVREMSAEVLCSVISVHRNRRILIRDDCGVSLIMQLLSRDEGKFSSKKSLLSLLLLVAESGSGRKKILGSDHLQCLEKMARVDEPEAKKVMKKLSGNRFRSVLNGIWSY